ncbi:hypothetical protein [uncultured Tateyamaria sp.]|uniref:hypothetical protein n=1 Tax=uncultured Tateyamaria sp. TaxID=455651 RepID=UPI002610BF65|nr:hypothetical protein [uncultured Tateyamaria sp.]
MSEIGSQINAAQTKPATSTPALEESLRRETAAFRDQVYAQRAQEDVSKLIGRIAKDTSEISDKLDQNLDKN